MKRRAFLVLSAAVAAPVFADQATFAGGRGHIAFEGGYAGMTVAPVRSDGYIAIDGVPVVFAEGVDFIDGQFYGGSLSYVLPDEDVPTWFGLNLRVFGTYEHQKASASERIDSTGPTMTDGIDVTSVSSDGRAFASSFSHSTYADAQTGIFAPAPDLSLLCSEVHGSVAASATQTGGLSNTVNCTAGVSFASAQSNVTQGGTVWVAIANASLLPDAAVSMLTATVSRYSVVTKRGEAGFAGDRRLTDTLTISPSLSVSIGERQARFSTLELVGSAFLAPDFIALRVLEGGLDTRDAALNLGLRATYDVGAGFDLFGAIGGAVVHRKTRLVAEAATVSGIFGETTIAASVPAVMADGFNFDRSDTTAVAQATLELGAGYTLDSTIGIGPLRLSVTGAIAYDSDVPTYGNLGSFTGPLSGPIAPAHIAYRGETSYTVTAGITLELP